MMRAVGAFAAVALMVMAIAGLVLSRFYGSPDEIRSIAISGAVAFGVQLLTFVMLKLAGSKNVMAAWGVGAVVRLVMLVTYALVIVPAVGLTTSAPLFLAVFFFLTMLVEPLLLTL